MATLTVRNIDDKLHGFLRQQAAEHGRSMEAEVRAVLRDRMRMQTRSAGEIARELQSAFAGLDTGTDLDQPPRPPARPAPDFGG